jgi:hypothetical protein
MEELTGLLEELDAMTPRAAAGVVELSCAAGGRPPAGNSHCPLLLLSPVKPVVLIETPYQRQEDYVIRIDKVPRLSTTQASKAFTSYSR